MRCGKNLSLRILGGVVLICLASAIAEAAGPKDLGTFKGWSALLLVENKAKICYLHGVPGKSAGKYKKRGDTYLQVTHRTQPKIRNEVSVTAGYNYRKGHRHLFAVGLYRGTQGHQQGMWIEIVRPGNQTGRK